MPRRLSRLGISGLIGLATVVGVFSTVYGQSQGEAQYPAFGSTGSFPAFGGASAFPAFGNVGAFPAFEPAGSGPSFEPNMGGSYVAPGLSPYGAPPGASPPTIYYNGNMGPYSPVFVPRANESPGGNAQYGSPYYNNTQPNSQPAFPGSNYQPAQQAAGAQMAPPYGYVYLNSSSHSLGTAQFQPQGAYGYASVSGTGAGVGTSTITGPTLSPSEYFGIGYGQYGMPAAPGVNR